MGSILQPQLQSCKRNTDTGQRRDFKRECSGVLVSIKKKKQQQQNFSLRGKKIPEFADFYGINIPTWPTRSSQCAITEYGAGREAPGISQEPVERAPGTPPSQDFRDSRCCPPCSRLLGPSFPVSVTAHGPGSREESSLSFPVHREHLIQLRNRGLRQQALQCPDSSCHLVFTSLCNPHTRMYLVTCM